MAKGKWQVPEWGWRMKCCHEGCTEVWEKWQGGKGVAYTNGPPRLPYQWEDGPEGWFFSRCPSGRHEPLYFAYCPAHAHEALGWRERLEAWTNSRCEAGKAKHLSWLDKVKTALGLIDPKKETAREMAAWVEENPKPTAPWESV